ncbi:MAG: DUF2062 domain-containing protein [Holophagaceae bacterium]|nr:DUF2062 domain-containing protein [Holophagaceae bacterium]
MTVSAPDSPPAQKPSFLSRIKGYILLPDLTPKRIAISFAIGFCVAWNPILGLHTWIALGSCLLAKGLHRPLLLSATFINNPWTMIPIATLSVFFGNCMLGRGWMGDLSGIAWKSIGISSFTTRQGFDAMYAMLQPILLPYLLGGFSLSILAFPLGYWFMLRLTKRLRRGATPTASANS